MKKKKRKRQKKIRQNLVYKMIVNFHKRSLLKLFIAKFDGSHFNWFRF